MHVINIPLDILLPTRQFQWCHHYLVSPKINYFHSKCLFCKTVTLHKSIICTNEQRNKFRQIDNCTITTIVSYVVACRSIRESRLYIYCYKDRYFDNNIIIIINNSICLRHISSNKTIQRRITLYMNIQITLKYKIET